MRHKANHDAALEHFKDELENLDEICKIDIQQLKQKLRLKINSIRRIIKNKQNNFCEVIIYLYWFKI
jgi:frataxin-like iron-binding protein CyaY